MINFKNLLHQRRKDSQYLTDVKHM